jgi:fatty acid desaturase (delta-4 desaturase)
MPGAADPWNDPKYADVKWTVYRDRAYDLQPFYDKHPGGSWLLNLAIGRDCTALIESYHLRPEVSDARFRGLPKLDGFPVDSVPKSPRPNDSPLYNAIRDRVRTELFGDDHKYSGGRFAHRTGGDAAAATIVGTAAVALTLYAKCGAVAGILPAIATGAFLGLAGAWIGLTIQHCGNHGAMSPKVWVNNALGMTDDLIGGSSLMWRYHHQVSHHIHCNDNALDQDVHTAMPLLRFDARQPKKSFHKYQHLYLFLAFPLMQLAFQVGDIQGLLTRDCEGAKLHGATNLELATVVLGKIAHFSLLLAPAFMGASAAAVAAGVAAFTAVQGMVLACTFAVSHNVAEAKIPEDTGGEAWERDWGVQQVVTSADWGDKIGNFFTGGLNLQVEHHLFPAVCFVHYPAIRKIVREEAAKAGVPYSEYRTLPGVFAEFMKFVKDMGTAEQIGDIAEPASPNRTMCPLGFVSKEPAPAAA